jgi:hypothetical protein
MVLLILVPHSSCSTYFASDAFERYCVEDLGEDDHHDCVGVSRTNDVVIDRGRKVKHYQSIVQRARNIIKAKG